MNNDFCKGIEDLLVLFEDSISPADALAAKLTAQISTCFTKERLRLHMTQHEFAEHIGATQSLISRWEKGDYNFSIKKICEIASALNLNVNISMQNMALSRECDYFHESLSLTKTIQYAPEELTSKDSQNSYNAATYSKKVESNHKEEYKYVTVC